MGHSAGPMMFASTEAKTKAMAPLTPLVILAIALAGCHGLDETPLEDDHSESRTISEVNVFDHETGEELLEFHDDHWDGRLPDLEVDEELELDVVFKDQDGNTIPLGTAQGYEVRARLAEGAATDIISIEDHIDHIDIEGLEEGTTSIVFELWHDDHVEWTSPPAEITVVEGQAESG